MLAVIVDVILNNEKAPAGFTGSFSMLFLMVFGRFPEKFILGILLPFQPDYRSNNIRLIIEC